MGVNALAYFRHTFDVEQIRLLPAALANSCRSHEVWIWSPDDPDPRRSESWGWDGGPGKDDETIPWGDWAIDGPGILIHIYPQVMCVWSLARWRDFLTSPDLRTRVRRATAKIVRSLGGNEVIWVPDWFLNDWPDDEALTIDAMRVHLLEYWGFRQPSLDPVEDSVVEMAEHSSPKVWFEETV